MSKEQTKKILEDHLINLSKISETLTEESNPAIVLAISESIKQMALSLFLIEKL